MGINECAGVGDRIASRTSLRSDPFYLGVVLVVAGAGLSLLVVRAPAGMRTRSGARRRRARGVESARRVLATTIADRTLASVSQAGLVDNLNDGLARTS
jgi:hypothetical protein